MSLVRRSFYGAFSRTKNHEHCCNKCQLYVVELAGSELGLAKKKLYLFCVMIQRTVFIILMKV